MASVKVEPAKILKQTSHQIYGKLLVTEHFFDVPKDYANPGSGTIRLFARSVRKHEKLIVPDHSPEKTQVPWMCYLNGGPGVECRPPQQWPWTHRMLDAGYQILFLDPRGTGLSTPITASTLQLRGDSDVQAKYLKLFRADNIVRDCEAVRQTLTADYPQEKKKWSTMGQSFGGFCTLTYLSFYPEGLRECFLFGGLAPFVRNPDEVYRRLYKKVIQRNEAYYNKYPEDVERVRSIMHYLQRFGDGKIRLPSDGSLTRRRFRQLGLSFGMHGGLDNVHDVVMRAANDIELFGHLTRGTLAIIESTVNFDNNMIYAILHEPIYCVGQAPNWSAHRLQEEYSQFDIDGDGPVLFTGEMIYPWMFEDYADLSKVKDAAERVAASSDWPELYDEEQLAKNEVPVYAAAYVDDMYVDIDFSLDTARKVKGCKVLQTNNMFHDALRSRMEEVVKQVFDLRDDVLE